MLGAIGSILPVPSDFWNGDICGRYAYQRHQSNVHRCRNTKGRQCHPDTSACQRAQAIKTVHHRQNRFIHFSLNGGTFNVYRHFRKTKTYQRRETNGKEQGRCQPIQLI